MDNVKVSQLFVPNLPSLVYQLLNFSGNYVNTILAA